MLHVSDTRATCSGPVFHAMGLSAKLGALLLLDALMLVAVVLALKENGNGTGTGATVHGHC